MKGESNLVLTIEHGVRLLQGLGAKITSQRVAIMKSLEGRYDHPSAEQLFIELRSDHPAISIATIYSTAQLLASASFIKILTIDEKKVYFDSDTSPHGHFMCKSCRLIVNVPVDFEPIEEQARIPELAVLSDSQVFFYGLCTHCVNG